MDPSHRTSDRQSLLLTQAALESLRRQPELMKAAVATLDHWDAVAPAASHPLRQQWRHILADGDFSPVLAEDDRGQQLRQVSPLAKVIDPAERLAIIRACKGRNSNT